MSLLARSAKLIPYAKRPASSGGIATCYTYEPEPDQGSELGTLAVVIEVLGPIKQAEEVVDLVIQTVGEEYYNKADHANEPLERFERAVKQVNRELAEYIEQGKAAWVGKLSAVIAIIAEDHLHLTQAGSASGYLYRGNKTGHISDNLGEREGGRGGRIFSSIASGHLEVADRLLFTTPALLHCLGQPELKAIVQDNNPNSAVKKLSERLEGDENADRVAALISEITTAELLAAQYVPEAPDEAMVGTPQSLLDSAKETAAPLAAKTTLEAKKAVKAAAGAAKRELLPRLQRLALAAVAKLRQLLRGKAGKRNLAIGVAVGIILLGFGMYRGGQATDLKKLQSNYDAVVAKEHDATLKIAEGDKASARALLATAQADLTTLSKSRDAKKLDASLSHRVHPEYDPASLAGLATAITTLTDQIDGLVRANATTLAELKDIHPAFLELAGTNLVAIDPSGAIQVYNLTNHQTTSITAPKDVGTISAATASSSGDGVYLLTDKPSVWFVKLDDQSITEQTISFGEWPKGVAIGSYTGNLYILGTDGQIYKHSKTAGGFSAKTAYLPASLAGSLTDATGITVDGSIYVTGGAAQLRRYLSGTLKQTVSDLPDSLAKASVPLSTSDGDVIVLIDTTSGRVGILGFVSGNLTYSKQILLSGAKQLMGFAAEPTGKTLYTIADGKLVSFPSGL